VTRAKFDLSPAKRMLLERMLREDGLRGLGARITAGPRPAAIPLSFAQERLWFLDQLEPNTGLYNLPASYRLKGLNVRALEETLSELVRRHEALRTSFETAEGKPVQVIHSPAPVKLEIAAVAGADASEREAQARQMAAVDAQEPFELRRGPLFRARLLRLEEDDYVLLLNMHHIVSDGWSMGVLAKELASLYDSYLRGRRSALPELPLQYADFAIWQRQWLSGEVLERHLQYWREQLQGAPAMLELPSDRARPPVQSYRGAAQSFLLGRELSERVKRLGQRQGATLFMTLLAAFQVLLARYSGQSDILIGTPIANRNRAELEGLIGFFVNTLVLRARLEDDPSFEQLLRRVKETTLAAYAHQDLPFEKLVEELQPQRDLSHNPLFQVMFVLQNAPGAEGGGEAPNPATSGVQAGGAKFDLTLSVSEAAAELAGVVEYNTDLYEADTVRRMMSHWRRLLESAAANPGERISRLALLSESESRQLLLEWNQTEAGYRRDLCIHQLFEQQVERSPQRAAVECGAQVLSYAELNRRANRIARYLQQRGVGPEVRVGLSLARSFEMIAAVLGVLKAGGAYVPLDPAYPEARRRYMLADAQVEWLLQAADIAQALASSHHDGNPHCSVRPANLAYVLYTSGSTGQPKGVAVTHTGLCNLAQAQQSVFQQNAGSRICQFASLSFDASIFEIVMALCSGATLCLGSGAELAPGESLARFLLQQHITTLTIPPSLLACMNAQDFNDLSCVIVAGEACPAALVTEWARNRRVFNAYGPTETTVWATVSEARPEGARMPIGRPIANTRMYVLDRNLELLPPGVPGELYIGGVSLARGYWNRPETTAERFVPDPFSGRPGERLYRSGDWARWLPDGSLECLGRMDRQIKIRGLRIEPGEIESALLQHDCVAQAAVLAQNGNGSQQLIACVRLRGAEQAPDFRSYLRERLPEPMVPNRFVILDALPVSVNGKLDYAALRRICEHQPVRALVAERRGIAKQLEDLWKELLGVQQVGMEDFFELGGHSLLATQLVSRIRQVFGLEIPLRAIFESPTVEEMAGRLEAARPVSEPAITPQPRASYRLSRPA